MAAERDWIDYASAFGSIGTVGTFLYLFYQQMTNRNLQERLDFDNTQQQTRNNIQQFENSLFNLLALHNQIINNLNYFQSGFADITPDRYTQGLDTFNDAYAKLRDICQSKIWYNYTKEEQREFKKPQGERNIENEADARQTLTNQYYKYYYNRFEPTLNHYFRNLYHIYKYIDESDLISDPLRHRYSSIVRAQLSQSELYTIMFNMMIQGYGYPKMTLLDKKYNVLKNFRKTDKGLKYFIELYDTIKHNLSSKDDTNGIEPIR